MTTKKDMEQKSYRVLWIDDKHDKIPGFKLQAKQNGINLIAYKSLKGLDELEENYQTFDGIILDAKFFNDEDDKDGSEDLKRLNEAKDRLLSLPKRFKLFVLTGQAKLFKDDTFNTFFPNYYRKGIDDDITQLFADIKREADQSSDTQIRHQYTDVFEIFSEGYLGRSVANQLLVLLKSGPPKNVAERKAVLVNIRSIHESCIAKLEEVGIVPDSQAAFNEIIRHLSGNRTKENGYEPTTTDYQNDSIEDLHKWLYFTCGKYIHNLKDKDYNGYMISNYAIESLRAGLLEILLWFKKTMKENS